jgi:hypothetical protein
VLLLTSVRSGAQTISPTSPDRGAAPHPSTHRKLRKSSYKQLLVIERAWREMKTTLDLRPVHDRKQDRIRAHVLLGWLLLLIRIAEN